MQTTIQAQEKRRRRLQQLLNQNLKQPQPTGVILDATDAEASELMSAVLRDVSNMVNMVEVDYLEVAPRIGEI
jgi:hypothetical protein